MANLLKRLPPAQEAVSSAINFIKDAMEKGHAVPIRTPVTHHFSDNIYCREIFMPAGSVVVGKKHATRHLNVVLSGECEIWTVQEHMHLKAGAIFESMAGVQKVVKMITDVRFLTIHYNPDELREESQLEGKYIRPTEQLPLFPELDKLSLGETKKLENA